MLRGRGVEVLRLDTRDELYVPGAHLPGKEPVDVQRPFGVQPVHHRQRVELHAVLLEQPS